ncbi:MAG: imidazole glycerol phosphate synthase subunit HisH [Candidatus Magnetobacterium sp. LHC-1]|uniref:Imidazole glycerol phosphate synthase subunit HisH n=1 Tax=Candidatus Magnetobacterium casense TaxID=1455061 RepID=A0ABS6RUY2_9BACT|nr:imidazole glycerol phosphate synthase subunit HisH [Candidatus Magnetobacterium casensis]MBF0609326.1 imidazole glycerol phosphate synthase subunit HisH [Nitrospirota bacterium]MBV6340252.1 imidazole glycerol phosphate synthase subunit HisH [Candidatus Magnetobacterium casensis]
MIAIVDYGMGNLRSVAKGFAKVGADAVVTSSVGDIENASGVVLPGVGAFRDCMANLEGLSLAEVVVRCIEKGKPFLGICLGLQLLFTESEEFGHCRGLNVFDGKVVRFPVNDLKVPHMGWNRVMPTKHTSLMSGIASGDIPDGGGYFYFVHSFYVAPTDESIVAATTQYGIGFTSMVARDNVFAMQFHPEKSQKLGLGILKNFAAFVKKT